LPADAAPLVAREFGVSLADLVGRLVGEEIEQIVDLDADALPARDLDERLPCLFAVRGDAVAERPRRRVRQRHHLVGKMNRILGFDGMSERPQRLAEQRLQVHLTRVDDIVNPLRVAERRRRLSIVGRRGPQFAAVPLREVSPVLEVAAEQPQLPELVREILADVGDDAVRSDDYLFARLFRFVGRLILLG